MNANNASNSNEFDPEKTANNQKASSSEIFDLDETDILKEIDSLKEFLERLESIESGKLAYNHAEKKLFGAEEDYEGGMEDMIKSAKKGYPDALDWLVNAGIRLIIPEVLWENNNIQGCESHVLQFCRENTTGPHAAMANLFLGLMCRAGKGVEKNEELANDYFKEASKGPFLDEYGNDAGYGEQLGGQLVYLYLDIFSCNKESDNYGGEAQKKYWDLHELGELLCNGLHGYRPFFVIDKYFILPLRLNVLLKSGEYLLAEEYIESLLNEVSNHERILFEPFRSILFQQCELEKINQRLKAKERELEETMAMFAHKFRSPLDAIIYNTSHEHQPKLYIQAAQTMRGLLDIFSIISTDADTLQDKLKQDCQGSGNLTLLFSKTLDMILLHVLSVSATEKIQQHYLRHAKAHGLCAADLTYKAWNEEHFELERQLQSEWEQSYAKLLSESATLEHRLAWLEQRFFKLELRGFERADIQFKEYGITESFLTILLNELLVNAFKYYASAEAQPVVLEWIGRDGFQVLSCRNPSLRSERDKLKGSGKGHTFLSALARITGSHFSKPTPQNDYVVEFAIADQLLISS